MNERTETGCIMPGDRVRLRHGGIYIVLTMSQSGNRAYVRDDYHNERRFVFDVADLHKVNPAQEEEL